MNTMSDFNKNKQMIAQIPNQFFIILQDFFNQTNAEFIFIEPYLWCYSCENILYYLVVFEYSSIHPTVLVEILQEYLLLKM